MDAKTAIKVMYQERPLVFGHRGASAYAPENTIDAFELAAEQGAHGVELDVQLSKDGKLVVIHDFDTKKTTGNEGRVADQTLAQLKALDAGSWFDASFKDARIPTLDEVFEAVGQKLFINVEIKYMQPEPQNIEQKVIDCIEAHNLQDRVLVSSFNPRVLKRFRQACSSIPLGYLYAPQTMDGKTQALMPPSAHEARHPHHDMINEATMAYAREISAIVNAWTVNDPARARQLRLLGVDGIITDNPDKILVALS